MKLNQWNFMDQIDVPHNRFQGLHHQFVASALAVKMAHEIRSKLSSWMYANYGNKLWVNMSAIDQIENQQKNHLMNWFCSDVQCRGKYPNYIKRYFKENNIKIHMEEGDEEILSSWSS